MKLNELDDGWGHKGFIGRKGEVEGRTEDKVKGILGEYLNKHQVKFV
jgi:hypothetical protein